MHPPDPDGAKGRPGRRPRFRIPINPVPRFPTEAVADFQARSLRRRFAIGYYLAASVAPLISGLPR